jgi:hypothetical protein
VTHRGLKATAKFVSPLRGATFQIQCLQNKRMKGIRASTFVPFIPFIPFTPAKNNLYARADPAVCKRPLTASQSMFEKKASMYFGRSAGA